jgi:hypothetical protein
MKLRNGKKVEDMSKLSSYSSVKIKIFYLFIVKKIRNRNRNGDK